MTPTETITAFLEAWVKGNKTDMHKLTSYTWQSIHDETSFTATDLKTFEVVSYNQNINICDVMLKLNNDFCTVRLIREVAAYNVSNTGTWGVYPGSFRKV